jgi:hypothetical protein
MFQTACFSQRINHPGTRKRSSQHDPGGPNFAAKWLIFYYVHVRSVFPGSYVKNIAYIADSKQAEGEGLESHNEGFRKGEW